MRANKIYNLRIAYYIFLISDSFLFVDQVLQPGMHLHNVALRIDDKQGHMWQAQQQN